VTSTVDVRGEFVLRVLDISFHSVSCLLPDGIVALQFICIRKCLISYIMK
jgi:hypothetical protein